MNQLRYLTSERYQLKVEGIGDLKIIDRWNANEERPVETLSGGESFLTSLALALALADLSRGRAQLNSLFLDEGFGTLDTETLDIAIAALEGLRMQGRSIFLISHIQELTRRLPVKINVRNRETAVHLLTFGVNLTKHQNHKPATPAQADLRNVLDSSDARYLTARNH